MDIKRSLLLALMAVFCSMSWAAKANAGGSLSPITVDIDPAKLLAEIGQGIAWLTSRHDLATQNAIDRSRSALQASISELAALNHLLAASLRSAAENGGHFSDAQKQETFDDLREMGDRLLDMRYALQNIDPRLAEKSTDLTVRLFSDQAGKAVIIKGFNAVLDAPEDSYVAPGDLRAWARKFQSFGDEMIRVNRKLAKAP